MIRTNHQCHLDAPVWINAQQAISLLQWSRSRSDTPAAYTHASESTGCEFEPGLEQVGHLNQKARKIAHTHTWVPKDSIGEGECNILDTLLKRSNVHQAGTPLFCCRSGEIEKQDVC